MASDKINDTAKNLTVSWGRVVPQDQAELDALYGNCFPVEANHSFFEDFPVWNPALSIDRREQIVGRDQNGKILCSASLRIANLPQSENQIAMLGAVVCDLDHRGQGLASEAIEKILESKLLESAQIRAVVLWGSEKSLYSRFGFDFGGTQKRGLLGQLVFPEFLPDPTLDVQLGWDDEIFHLMRGRETGLAHLEADISWLKKHENVVWFRIIRDGKTSAYVGVNRGIDLMGVVHEWGGSEMDLSILLSALKGENPNLQIIFHPDHEKKYSFFKKLDPFENDQLCMIKWYGEPDEKFLSSLWFFGLDSC